MAAKGHSVLCPDLATHGYDPTPPGAVASMDQYTMPAQNAINAASEKVILVGHSMGGVSCTYLAEKFSEKVNKAVYLSAFLCADGKCANNYIFSPAYMSDPMAEVLFKLLSPDEAGVRLALDDLEMVKAAFYGDCTDHDVAIAAKNVIAISPAAPNIWKTETTSARFGTIPCVYIECTQDKAIPIAQQRFMQEEAKAAKVDLTGLSMDTNHSASFSKPEALAGIIDAACEPLLSKAAPIAGA